MIKCVTTQRLSLGTVSFVLLILTTFATAKADNSIVPLQIVPDVIFLNAPAQVLVTAAISSDLPLIENSVVLVRLEDNGRRFVVGKLYDDGTHGDEHASDGVFAARVSFSERKLGDIRLIVSAAYRGGLRRLTSSAMTLTVTRRPSSEELRQTMETEQTAGRRFATMRQKVGDDAARVAVTSELRSRPNVAASGVSSDGHTIWIRYTNGLEADILAGPPGTMGGANSAFLSPAADLSLPEIVASQKAVSCSCAQQTDPKVKPVVLAPFFDQFSPYDASDDVASTLERTCLDPSYSGKVRPVKNSAVNLGTMKNLYQFNVVYINTHGGVDSNGKVEIATREEATIVSKVWNFADWWKGRITPVSADGTTFYWAINPSFVDYYASGRFKKAVVYLSACDTFGAGSTNLSLANAFLNNGAVTCYGWLETVHTLIASSTSRNLFNTLTDPKLSSTSRSTGRAFDAISPKTDPIPPNAVFSMTGAKDVVLSVPTTDQCPKVVVSTGLQLSPKTGPYHVGQPISSSFTLTNRGNARIVMSQVLTSGRVGLTCPGGVCPDSTSRNNITLDPGASYVYSGTFTPSIPGRYTLSVAYRKTDGSWVIPVEPEKGAANTLGIIVQNPPPKLTGKTPAFIAAGVTPQLVYLNGTGLSQILYCYVQYPTGGGVYIYIPLSQVKGRSDTQLETRIKFPYRGTYYISAFTMDGGRSNALPIVVN